MTILGIITRLNDYSGLFALLALMAAIFVPVYIYRNQKKDERRSTKNELDAMNFVSGFPMSHEEREFHAKKRTLEKKLRRK